MPTPTFSPLLTDFYQLAMAFSYWQLNKHQQEAVFHLFFRRHPFQGNYTICCGLENIIDFINHWKFAEAELNYLRTLKSPANTPLFTEEFLKFLAELRFSCDIDAIPEGTVVFPHEPLLRIKGPILQCQLLETALINFINFSSLIATKATRICYAANPNPVIEFGLRRAQGPDGGLLASRAAYIGGCTGTSNVLAGQLYHIPAMGTQAHSWIMAFDDELSAFAGFAKAMPTNVILLVDTYNTLQGIHNAIKIGKTLHEQGHKLLAIRLDSGDLAVLSQAGRKMLDAAGFQETQILASGDLDEYSIANLKANGAAIDLWGVGTRLVTAYDQPAMDFVYKLSAIKNAAQQWDYKLKISDSPNKTTLPGILATRRYFQGGSFLGDVIYDVETGIDDRALFPEAEHQADLLVPIFRGGKQVYTSPEIAMLQKQCIEQLKAFRNSGFDQYAAKLEPRLLDLKLRLSTGASYPL
ncbi:MAG TPA: nicotinate phosphoribosyltransferase [Gammaproteobacteria bacterium]|nr:nicotinate phosphoribosyltransferase [Gammaproteobacteria bacterium]